MIAKTIPALADIVAEVVGALDRRRIRVLRGGRRTVLRREVVRADDTQKPRRGAPSINRRGGCRPTGFRWRQNNDLQKYSLRRYTISATRRKRPENMW